MLFLVSHVERVLLLCRFEVQRLVVVEVQDNFGTLIINIVNHSHFRN
jgi:hypothetical protein